MHGDVYRVVDCVKDVGDKGNPSHWGNENQNHSEISLIPTGLASVKLEGKKKTISVGKGVQKLEPSCIITGGIGS